jgi:hypothetical protein
VEFSRRDDDDFPTLRRIHTRLANVIDLTLNKDDELIIIVAVKARWEGVRIVNSASARIAELIVYQIVFPVCDLVAEIVFVLKIM